MEKCGQIKKIKKKQKERNVINQIQGSLDVNQRRKMMYKFITN